MLHTFQLERPARPSPCRAFCGGRRVPCGFVSRSRGWSEGSIALSAWASAGACTGDSSRYAWHLTPAVTRLRCTVGQGQVAPSPSIERTHRRLREHPQAAREGSLRARDGRWPETLSCTSHSWSPPLPKKGAEKSRTPACVGGKVAKDMTRAERDGLSDTSATVQPVSLGSSRASLRAEWLEMILL